MEPRIVATDDIVARYFELFVNRKAYTVQSSNPSSGTGRCYYYRPKGRISLSQETIRGHLEGRMTIGLYAINPATQRCKWLAIDADYSSALDDLLKLQWELRQDGVEAALEKSRRGGHLWIFAAEPLLARHCRHYIYALAKRLKVPVKAAGLGDGIEVFPKQNEVRANEFGNALRGPLGIHRGVGKRYWFYGADYTLGAQTAYLERLKRITENEMARFVDGLELPEELASSPKEEAHVYVPSTNPNHREFRILEHVSVRRKAGRNYWARCPSCAKLGQDKSGDNLAISVSDPRKYKCWAGCGKEQIRAALGCPIRTRHGASA
jgi:hypothetical protein